MEKTEPDDLLSAIQSIFEKKIPFNKVLGMSISSLDPNDPRIRFEMREELVGNYHHGNLHGGVTASALDVTGGLVAFLAIQQKYEDDPLDKRLERFGRLGTIDLRIDYLRPGIGHWFEATGHILRLGSKVAVVRVELQNDKGKLVAVGTGAYTVS